MFEIDPINFIDKLSIRWHKKLYLCIVIAILLVVYFFILRFFFTDPMITLDQNMNHTYLIIFNIVIPIVLISITIFIWFFSTNRFFIKLSNKIIAGIILKVDEENEQVLLNKILNKTISQINRSGKFPNVLLKILPPNLCTNENELNSYHKKNGFLYDLLITLDVHNGKFDSIEKIKISRIFLTFKTKSKDLHKKVFFNVVDLLDDMQLQASSKDWVYEYNNSGTDKVKYLENLYEIFLFYISLYSIYLDRYEDALSIMYQLYDNRKVKVPITLNKNNQIVLNLKLSNLAHGRIATILVDLFFSLAVKSYYNKDTRRALHYMEKLKNLLEKHPQKFYQFIDMARYSYELGNLNDAIKYTKEAQNINNNAVEIYLNNGFFAILNDDIDSFIYNFEQIFTKNLLNNLNWVDIYAFQDAELSKMPDKKYYFDFSMASINFLYITNIKLAEYKGIVYSYKDLEKYNKLYDLGYLIISNHIKQIKKINHKTNPKRRRRRKK